jgi:hypothetical protein
MVILSHASYSSNLKMEVIHSSKTLIPTYQTTQCYIPEDRNLHSNHYGNLKSHLTKIHFLPEMSDVSDAPSSMALALLCIMNLRNAISG